MRASSHRPPRGRCADPTPREGSPFGRGRRPEAPAPHRPPPAAGRPGGAGHDFGRIDLLPRDRPVAPGALRLHPPHDAWERDADRAADGVARDAAAHPAAEDGGAPVSVRPVSAGAGAALGAAEAETAVRAVRGPGRPLADADRERLGSVLGADLRGVRVHTGPGAIDAAATLGARAFTLGRHIALAPGEYAPGTPRGRRLLAHEVAHVLQQATTGAATPPRIQRQTLTGAEAYEEVSRDRIYEYFAHDIGYDDELSERTERHVRRLGFRAGPAVHGRFGMVVRVFTPLAAARERGHVPIVVFRGTEPDLRDAFDDLSRAGVGIRQYRQNRTLIDRLLRAAGHSDLTGHSLGGALAQMAAASHPSQARRVVTFQAPGIPLSMARAAARSGDIRATHYRAAHDIVDDVGAAHLPGTAYELGFDRLPPERPGASEGEQEFEAGVMPGVVEAHTSTPIDRLRELHRRSPERLRQVEVTRTRVALPRRERLAETFRRDVLGVEHPEEHAGLSPDEMLEQLSRVRGEMAARMDEWMAVYGGRLGELDPDLVFLLMEVALFAYDGAARVDMLIQILDSAAAGIRPALHRRLIRAVNPNAFPVAPGWTEADYRRLTGYGSGGGAPSEGG